MTRIHAVYLGICGLLLAGLIGAGVAWLRAHDAWMTMQAQMQVRAAQNQASAATVKTEQTKIDTRQTANAGIDAETKRKIAGLTAQLGTKPNTEQVKAIVQGLLPGIKPVEAKDAQGNPVIAVPDTQESRDAINKADVAFKTCQFSLDGCEAKQKNFQDIIASKDVQIGALNDTIKRKDADIKDLSAFGKGGNFWSRTLRVAVPIGCAAGGAWLGSTKGTKGAAVGALAGGGVCAAAIRF